MCVCMYGLGFCFFWGVVLPVTGLVQQGRGGGGGGRGPRAVPFVYRNGGGLHGRHHVRVIFGRYALLLYMKKLV